MAQDGTTAGGASYTLDNVTFPVGRNKLQSIFDAIRSTNIGNTAPDLVAGQFWIDNNTPSTTVWTLYFYDGTDSISFATIDTINNTVNFIDSAFDLIVDTTPQLGGDLDLNSNDITGTGNINITGNATVSGDLTVDTDTLYVDSSDNRVGITTTNPQEILDLGDGNNQNFKAGLRTYVGSGRSNGGTILGHTVKADTDAVSGNSPMLVTETNSGGGAPSAIRMQSGEIEFHTAGSGTLGATFDSERMRIAQNGDISFYEDTGTTPKFYWDASEERLGIGTSSPGTTLEVTSSVNSISSIFGASLTQDDWTGIGIGYKGSSYTKSAIIFERTDTDFARGDLHFAVDGGADGGSVQLSDSKMVITSGGNVGIGTSSPNVSGLEISRATGSSSPTPVELRLTTTTNASNWSTTDPYARISFYSDDGSTSGPKIMNTIETITTTASGGISNLVFKGRTNKLLELNEDISYFYTGNTEAMRLDSSQNLDMTNGGGNIKLASGAGIDFSATAGTGTSELLDDYETGTFTVGTNSDATGAFTNETGEYTKIGNVVHVRIVMKVSTNFTSSNIDGLPFIADHATTSSSIFATNAFLTRSDTNGVIFGVISDGFSILTFKENNDFDDAHLPNTTNDVYRISFWYYSV